MHGLPFPGARGVGVNNVFVRKQIEYLWDVDAVFIVADILHARLQLAGPDKPEREQVTEPARPEVVVHGLYPVGREALKRVLVAGEDRLAPHPSGAGRIEHNHDVDHVRKRLSLHNGLAVHEGIAGQGLRNLLREPVRLLADPRVAALRALPARNRHFANEERRAFAAELEHFPAATLRHPCDESVGRLHDRRAQRRRSVHNRAECGTPGDRQRASPERKGHGAAVERGKRELAAGHQRNSTPLHGNCPLADDTRSRRSHAGRAAKGKRRDCGSETPAYFHDALPFFLCHTMGNTFRQPDYFTYSQQPSPPNLPAFGGKYQKSV